MTPWSVHILQTLSSGAVLIVFDTSELVLGAEAFRADADSPSFLRWPNVISSGESRLCSFGCCFRYFPSTGVI